MHSTALITGASSGLGAEFAEQLAAHGHEVILVARSADRLAKLAERLIADHGVRAHVLVQDLTEPDAARRIAGRLAARGLSVDLLVNNAGFGTCGRFEEISGARDHDQLTVNVVETAFFDTIGTRKAAVTGSMTTPEPVVRAALRGMDRDRGHVTPGLGNALAAHLTPRRPRTVVAAIAERITRKVLAPPAAASTPREHAA